MKKAVDYGSSPFSRLPDDIVVQIYNKVMDLKTLCYCQLISKRLGLIVFQADTISFNVRLRIDYENENRLDVIKEAAFAGALDSDAAPLLGSDSFPSAIKFIKRFTKIKSIWIQFPSYVNVVYGVSLIKRKTKVRNRGLVIIYSNYVSRLNEGSDKERAYTDECKAYSCLLDVANRFKKVLGCIVEFPLLEKVFVMDSIPRGIVTLSSGEIDELRNFLRSTSKNVFHGVPMPILKPAIPPSWFLVLRSV